MLTQFTLPPTKLDDALEQASRYFGVEITKERIHTQCKARQYCRPRQWVMAYLRWKHGGDLSLPQIAKMVKLSDHATVLYGERRAHELYPDAVFCGPQTEEPNVGPVSQRQLETIKSTLRLADELTVPADLQEAFA